jgi:hypothetical protein
MFLLTPYCLESTFELTSHTHTTSSLYPSTLTPIPQTPLSQHGHVHHHPRALASIALMQRVNVLPTAIPQDIEHKLRVLETNLSQATKKMEESGKNLDFVAAAQWQAVVVESTKKIAELRQQDSISEVLQNGFAVGEGFKIQIEKNPLTEFENYDKVSSQVGFEIDVREFEERMADAYPHGDFTTTYIKSKQMQSMNLSFCNSEF